jgi:acetolactate synthase-1/2/3 large subunit
MRIFHAKFTHRARLSAKAYLRTMHPQHEHPIEELRRQRKFSDEFIGASGAEILMTMCLKHDVRVLFGYPGGAILPVFDAIYERGHLFKFILSRHEQGAGHMAQGYSRATGKPGIVVVTSGPGATNVVTPLQDALMDGTPIVVFSGQV